MQRDPHLDTLVQERPSCVELPRRNSMNGVISNGFAPRCSLDGRQRVSVNWT